MPSTRPKRPAPKRRNQHAAQLAEPKYRQRVVPGRKRHPTVEEWRAAFRRCKEASDADN